MLVPEYYPSLKNSEKTNLQSVESFEYQAIKTPTSMPIPANPRRIGPPRKKPSKPTGPLEGSEEKPADRAEIVEEETKKVEDSTISQEDVKPTVRTRESIVSSEQEELEENKREEEGPTDVVDALNDLEMKEEGAQADVPPETISPVVGNTSSPAISGRRPPPPSYATEDVSETEGEDDESKVAYISTPSRISLSAAIPPLQAIADAARAEFNGDEATSTPQPQELSSQSLKAIDEKLNGN